MAINQLSGQKLENGISNRPNADIQYEEGHWTKLPSINYNTSLVTSEFIKEVSLNSSDDTKTLIASVSSNLERLSTIHELKSAPGNFNNTDELLIFISGLAKAIILYKIAQPIYENHNNITYKILNMSDDKEKLVTDIGGEILLEKDRGMAVIKIPSKLLTKPIREELGIGRVRIKMNLDDRTIVSIKRRSFWMER